MTTKFCRKCSEEKEEKLFTKNKDCKPNGRSNVCRKCTTKIASDWKKQHKEYNNKYCKDKRNEKKLLAIESKGGICYDCNGKFHLASYDFHHIDPSSKEINIGNILHLSDERLLQEISKCILLCSNCHRVRHFKHE